MPPSLRRRFTRLAAINVASNLTIPLVGLVDTAMLGHLADIRFLAGVALASLFFDYLFWGVGFLRMGTTGLTAQAVGRQDRQAIVATLWRGAAIAGVLGVVMLVLQLPLQELGFWLLGGTPEVEAAGRSYFSARIWGAPAALFNLVAVGWFLGREESAKAMIVTVVANLANVALNYVFIIRLDLAALGAGIATALSQYLMSIAAVVLIARSGGVRCHTAGLFDRRALRELVQLNGDLFVRTLCLISAFAVFTNFSALLGTALLAANSLLLRLLSLASYFIDGAAFAAESLAGIGFGGGDRRMIRRVLLLAVVTGELIAIALLLIGLVFLHPILGLLTSHTDVIELALDQAWWLVPILTLGSVAYMLDGFFLGLTAGTVLRRSMLLSTLVFFLPIALWALASQEGWLLWASMTALMAARTATLGWAGWPYLAAVADSPARGAAGVDHPGPGPSPDRSVRHQKHLY